ncbi:pilus assembly protein [Seohaeicola saemankumensis]|nr:pilus assembly protein [Seohaeicola saemankumensis]MCA0869375.1 pilus assembly protein [Seohaeicola saemankumensis]
MFNNSLTRFLRNFRDDTQAAVTLEFVLVMPFLFWAFMATYVFFDGYRQSNVNLKAAYSISDVISRETNAINEDYIDSMLKVLTLMTRSTSPTSLRVSVIRWDQDEDRYFVEWSATRNRDTKLDDENIGTISSRLPVMPDNDRVILVETTNTFVPLFNVGMSNKVLENFVFTRPRFAPQVVWES